MYTLPSERTYDWASYCGIPGGIPTRETIYQSFSSGASLSSISSAMTSCPADQVVYIGPGTYTGTLSINAANPCTVRGDGAGNTIINGAVQILGSWIPSDVNSWSSRSDISSGYTKDSTTITLSSTPGAAFVTGNLIMMAQNDDYDLVWHRTGNYAGSKNLRFLSRITGVSGNNVSFATPIPHTYTAGLSPVCVAYSRYNTLVGIENMTINGSSPVEFTGADRCWLKGVEVTGFGNQGLLSYNSSQCEVRKCYFHDCSGFPSDDGYWILMQYGNSCWKIEDNIAYRCMAMIYNSASGCYAGYNAVYDNRRTALPLIQPSFISNHGPHSIMNLWEGNMGQRFVNDGYHGSGSHDVLFRNHFHGYNSYTGWVNERRLIDLVKGSYYESSVGNVIGHSSYTPTLYQAYLMAAHDESFCYVLGWAEGGSADATTYTVPWEYWTKSFPDADVEDTLIRHANYDYKTVGIYEWADSDHTIADSLFYTSKPSWFGSATWPPIDPFTPEINDTPASWRWGRYEATSDIDDLFTEDIGEITGFNNTFTAVMAVSESEVARLYVEYPHRRVVTGTSATYAIWVEAYNSFTADVTLDATGLPTNATDSYSTNPIAYTGSSVATIATTGVAAGTYSITFTGTAEGGEVGSVRVILEVVASDDCAPKVPIRKIRVKQGDNAVFTVIADPTAGYTGDMDLSASGVPSGASGEFAEEQIAYNESTTYTVDSGTAAVGEHEITITGEGPA